MTIVEISKAQIIKSIKEEPALENRWIKTSDRSISLAQFNRLKKGCQVCAVGSVFRKIIDSKATVHDLEVALSRVMHNRSVRSFATTEESITEDSLKMLNLGYPMNALSMAFEGFWWLEHDIEKTRKNTLSFVRKHFPSKVLIDIDGLWPAKDVKVVKPVAGGRK